MEFRADLHFHPSFWSRGEKEDTITSRMSRGWAKHITELECIVPNLREVVGTSINRKMNLVSITSCSVPNHVDMRWSAYMDELGEIEGGVEEYSSMLVGFDFGDQERVYLVHGQEFKTDFLDVNVLFAERRIPMKESLKKSNKSDFSYILDAARASGDNVLITIPGKSIGLTSQDKGNDLSPKEIRHLFEKGKIDAIESYDAMDNEKNNKENCRLARRLEIPGIAVSDGHALWDLGTSHVRFDFPKEINGYNLPKFVKESVRYNDFLNHRKPLSKLSKVYYGMRLANCVFLPRI